MKSGFLIIDQQRAHERILYEEFLNNLAAGKGNAQQLLFPETIDFSASDAALITEIEPEIKQLGFNFNPMGKTTFVVSGIPAELNGVDVTKAFENLLEQFKINKSELQLDNKENIAVSLARSASIKAGKKLSKEEMGSLVDQLFACEMPHSLSNGQPITITLGIEDLNKQFNY